jgi:hypothetical protein
MAFTMACPNFKKGLKIVSGPLGVKNCIKGEQCAPELQLWVSCATDRSWDSRAGAQGCKVQILTSNWKSVVSKKIQIKINKNKK